MTVYVYYFLLALILIGLEMATETSQTSQFNVHVLIAFLNFEHIVSIRSALHVFILF